MAGSFVSSPRRIIKCQYIFPRTIFPVQFVYFQPNRIIPLELAKYHDGHPALPTTDADGSVVDVEMPAKGYAPGPLKTIASMERKARKIMTEPQNSDPTAAKNPFHRNHGSVRAVLYFWREAPPFQRPQVQMTCVCPCP